MRPGRHMKHTELFLVRIWVQDHDGETGEGEGKREVRGMVQRTVDGEKHGFQDWQGLLASLTEMLRAGQIDVDTLLLSTHTESASQGELSDEMRDEM